MIFYLGGIHAIRYKSYHAKARGADFSLLSLPQQHPNEIPSLYQIKPN